MSKQAAIPSHAVGQIVPIQQSTINEETVYTVNARDLHKALNVRDDFSTWMKRRINECGFVEKEDYLLLDFAEQQSTGTKHKKEYMIALDMAKHFAMLEKNATGHKVRQGFIDYEKQTRAMIATPQNTNLPAIPKDPLELFLMTAEAIKQLSNRTIQIESQLTQMEDVALEAVAKSEQAVTTVDDFLATRPLTHTQCYEVRLAVEKKKQLLTDKYSIPSGGTVYAGLYSFLKHHFRVNTYTGIPSARYDEALMIINNITLDQLPENVRKAVPKAKVKKGGVK